MTTSSTVTDPTDASGADGANSATDRKPRATRQPATKAQQDRIAELYESRGYPVEKQKPPEQYSKVHAARMISLLESRPLKEEQTTKPKAPRARKTAQTPATGQAKATTRKAPTKPQAPAAKASNGTDDKARAALAKKVVALRDKGVAWWRIGVELGLPGAGPLPTGKAGAGNARKLYLTIKSELPDPASLPKPAKK